MKMVRKLETFNIPDILNNVVSKVASIVAAAKKMGIYVGWINKVIGKLVPGEAILSCFEKPTIEIQFASRADGQGETEARRARLKNVA